MRLARRALLGGAASLGVALVGGCGSFVQSRPFTLVTLGDSILDNAHYNPEGVTPGGLLVRNDDTLFPAFTGRDLASRGPAKLVHRARDGATVDGLPAQVRGLSVDGPAAAILTIGGNDLLRGLLVDPGPGFTRFAEQLEDALQSLSVRPVLIGTVYDPSFGDDRRNFLGMDPARARAAHRRVNAILADAGVRYGAHVDLHGHFLTGDPSWLVNTIEPSARGSSEVRRAFLPALGL